MPARVDRWLWAVRLAPTRTVATDLCRAGHVAVGGRGAKPATTVVPGDRVEVRRRGAVRTVEVVEPIEQRVGAAVAATCYVDHTPPPPAVEEAGAVPRRERGAGRPTKRERRETDRFRGRPR